MERIHLLPKNATALERAVSEAIDWMPEIGAGAVSLRGFKYDPIDQIVPYLVAEFGLSEIEDYLSNLRDVLREGLIWQRERGTPAALHRALNWIGKDGLIEEMSPRRFKWWWFQVHLPLEQRDSTFVTPMIALAKASKPLRSEFARVTAGYDVRGFQLNGSRLNAGLLNSWSGVRRAAGEPVLSLRVHHSAAVEYGEGLGAVEGEWSSIHHHVIVDGAAPTEQKSSMPTSAATQLVSSSEPSIVPFNNAPFSATDTFGVPSPIVQTGN